MERRDFFVSYTQRDKAWAVWVARVLNDNGYSVYAQARDIRAGEDFLEKMEQFLENSDNFIVVWSKNYSKSKYCMNELRAAYHQWHNGKMNCLLPVLIDNYPMKALYSALVHVDLSDKSAASEAKLVDAVRQAVPRPEPKPEPPTPEKSPDSKPSKPVGGKARKSPWSLFTDVITFLLAILLIWGVKISLDNAQASLDNAQARELYLSGAVFQEKGDYKTARDYYEQAAAKGNASALCSLGYLYDEGLGVERDYAKARDYYEQAAAKGNAVALNNLGYLYQRGLGVDVDYDKARDYYEQAAKGIAEALNNLGYLYQHGLGVDMDYDKARDYYEQAAAKGNASALYSLGYLYQRGLGVDVDYDKARDYYEQAAAKGNAAALYNLGWMYEYGEGVDIDYEKALDYYQQAADAGDEDASAKLEGMRDKLNAQSGE